MDPADGKSILQKHKPRPSKRISKHVKRWTGVDPAAHVLKLGVPLELTVSGGLPKPVLEALGPWKPHIMPHYPYLPAESVSILFYHLLACTGGRPEIKLLVLRSDAASAPEIITWSQERRKPTSA